ncbi:MAG TPA: sigma-70 family RNA polymerase sigma factor [Gemmatales bacterium]|nr:sigma-70 family RNA polymerase sigma factor [Gemmatales bacterium]
MPTARYSTLLSRLPPGDVPLRTDRQLMERFLEDRDETAFTAIVTRHGPMVLGVCRRIIGSMHDAEDAFQATFLLLAQKAARIIPGDAVGPWLHGVACRVALKSRTMLRRRQRHERLAAQNRTEGQADLLPGHDLRSVLDQELQRLPRPYRLLVILCDLQGGTFRQVARQLQLPVGTLSGRLKRGRELLAERLARRGIALSASVLGLMLAEQATAQVPALWISTTARAATAWIAAESLVPGLVCHSVVTLVKGTATAMMWNQLKLVSGVGLLALLLSVGWLASSSTAQEKGASNPVVQPPVNSPVAPIKQDNPQYLVQLTLYVMNPETKQFDVVTSPRLIVHAHQKASIQTGQAEAMKSSKVTPDWWITGFNAEVEVQPQPDNEVILQIKAQQSKVREKKPETFITETHMESIVHTGKLTETIELPWEPFGRTGKMEVRVDKIHGQPPITEASRKPAVPSQVFPLTHVDAAAVVPMLKQVYQNKLNLITFDAKTNSVIIQGTAEEVKRCAEIIKGLDQIAKVEEAKPPQAMGLQPVYASPLANKVTGARLTVTVGDDFQLSKVLAVAKKLNQEKPRVELEYDFSKHQLSIRALVDDLKLSELSKVLEAGSPQAGR